MAVVGDGEKLGEAGLVLKKSTILIKVVKCNYLAFLNPR